MSGTVVISLIVGVALVLAGALLYFYKHSKDNIRVLPWPGEDIERLDQAIDDCFHGDR